MPIILPRPKIMPKNPVIRRLSETLFLLVLAWYFLMIFFLLLMAGFG